MGKAFRNGKSCWSEGGLLPVSSEGGLLWTFQSVVSGGRKHAFQHSRSAHLRLRCPQQIIPAYYLENVSQTFLCGIFGFVNIFYPLLFQDVFETLTFFYWMEILWDINLLLLCFHILGFFFLTTCRLQFTSFYFSRDILNTFRNVLKRMQKQFSVFFFIEKHFYFWGSYFFQTISYNLLKRMQKIKFIKFWSGIKFLLQICWFVFCTHFRWF